MFDTIVLITGDVEQPALASRLLEHNGGLLVAPVSTREELERIDRSVLQTCRIVSFVSDVIVPADVLHATGFGAYNFHPGSPDFPGWAPAAFAIDQRAPRFGATAHEMCERVDGGNIIDVEMFDILPETTFPELEALAYSAALRLFWRLSDDLANRAAPLPLAQVAWGGKRYTREDFAKLRR